MNTEGLGVELERLAAQPGIQGCALVDAGTGMIWLASAQRQIGEQVWEAAVDYWRLHRRQEPLFAAIGGLRAAVMYHDAGVLSVFPCGTDPEVLLISVGVHRGVDWAAWQARVRDLGRWIRAAR